MDRRDPRKYDFKLRYWQDTVHVFNSARTAPVTPQLTAASVPPVLVQYAEDTRVDGDLSLVYIRSNEQSIDPIFPYTQANLSFTSEVEQTVNINGINTHNQPIAMLEQDPDRATGPERSPGHSRKHASLPDLVVPSYPVQRGYLSPSPKSRRRTSFSSIYSDPSKAPSHIEQDEPLKRLIPRSEEILYGVNIRHINADRTEPMKNLKPFRWHNPNFYEELTESVNDFIQAMMVSEFDGHEVRFYYGSLRIVGQDHEYAVIIQEDANKKSFFQSEPGLPAIDLAIEEPTIRLICRFISEHPKERFRLKYFLEFASMQRISQAESYIDMLKGYIDRVKNINENFENKPFIPRPDRDIFTTLDSITKILKEMEPFRAMEPYQKEREVKALAFKITKHKAEVMFLACVTIQNCTIEHFEHIFCEGKYNDENLPPPEYVTEEFKQGKSEAISQQPHMDRVFYKILVRNISRFFVKTIEDNGQHWILKELDIMPIIPVRDDKGEEIELGRGSSGFLYRVRIVSGHHNLPEHKRSEFALKKMLRGQDPEGDPWDSFKRERAMLRYLRKLKDPHIVCHIMTWSQYGHYYILYPLATKNLHQYMKDRPPPPVTFATIRWFLRQLRGLINALNQVHEQLEEPGWEQMINDSTIPTVKIGYHHDIKPENILVFERRRDYNPIFKISDFGAGKFGTQSGEMSNGRTSGARSTPSYSGPEHGGKPSRPFDIWAMACVFTEIFTWLLLGQNEVAIFSDQRLSECNQKRVKYDTYFRRRSDLVRDNNDEDKEQLRRNNTDEEVGNLQYYFELMPIVDVKLTRLRDTCDEDWRSETDFGPKGALQGLSDLILSCFKIEPSERLTAKQLREKLDTMIERADFAAEPAGIVECATPVVQADDTGLPLAPSIDVVAGTGGLFDSKP